MKNSLRDIALLRSFLIKPAQADKQAIAIFILQEKDKAREDEAFKIAEYYSLLPEPWVKH